MKTITLNIRKEDFNGEWHLDILKPSIRGHVTDYYAFETFKRLTEFLGALELEDLIK